MENIFFHLWYSKVIVQIVWNTVENTKYSLDRLHHAIKSGASQVM